ncbi:MAG: nuclear transport factor 2 family protein [Burkholderiales bacterium]
MSAVEVVQRQLEAYNARDLAAFVACYHDDIRVFRPPAPEPALAGKAAFAEFYRTQRFNLPALHAEVVNRMALGRRVIDHERISGVRDQPFDIAVVYELAGDRIAAVWTFAAE